jgi:hypothetical protein
VVADWLADPLIHVEICSFEPARFSTLTLAHAPMFVCGVLGAMSRS